MKIAIVYFSHTGHAHECVKHLKKHISAESIRLIPVCKYKRPTIFRYFNYAFSSALNSYEKLEPYAFDSKKYDHLILVSPVWVGKLPPAMNTFLRDNQIDCDISLVLSCFVEFDFIIENMKSKKLKGNGSIRHTYVIYDCKKEDNNKVLNEIIDTIQTPQTLSDETAIHAEALY